MTQNPNWPLVDEAVSFQSGPNSPAPFPYWCSVIGRTEGQWTSRRGRQYEVDQVQAGTVTSTLRNDDAAFDPSNTSSPFYPQVTPWRGYRRRMQLPATVNLLTGDQATAWYATQGAGTFTTLPQWVYAGGLGYAIGAGPIGSNEYAHAIPANEPSNAVLLYMQGWSVTPGATFTGQAQVNTNGAAAISGRIQFAWFDCNGNVISTANGTAVALGAGAQTLTVTATAPANAAGGRLSLITASSPTANVSIGSWKWQIEASATASAWVTPGAWYDIFTGFVERWPQTWTDGGTYGVSQLTCVDAIAYLSQRRLRSPGYMEILALGPSWFYPLDDQTAYQFADLSGQEPAMDVFIQWNDGYTTLSGVITQAVTPPPSAAGISACLNLNNPEAIGDESIGLDLGAAVGTPPPAGPWTRVFSFSTPTTVPNYFPPIWVVGEPSAKGLLNGNGNQAALFINDSLGSNPGQLSLYFAVGSTSTLALMAPGNICDGKMHVAAVGINAAGTAVSLWLDGAYVGTAAGSLPPFTGTGYEYVGICLDDYGWVGDLSCVAHIPTLLTNTQAGEIASAILYGGSGLGVASSGTRYADILRWAQWAGQSSVDTFTTGECNTYGPSTDLLATAAQPGTDGVSAAQTVVDTDDGEHFVDRSGVVTFHARRNRFNQATPVVTFGDGTGEIPYTDCSFGLDPTRLANDAVLTQTSTQGAVTRLDRASINTYGDVQLQRNVNDTNAYSLGDMAQYLATHYANPVQRLETLRVEPATYTVNGVPSNAAWAALLSLELGMPVAINRRPPGVPMISFAGFVEQINWTMDDTGRAVCELQVSPNYGKQFWALDSSTFSVLGSTTILGY